MCCKLSSFLLFYVAAHSDCIHYPITLTPSPMPLSSPTVITTSISDSSSAKYDIEKWKHIAMKLSLLNNLRVAWNELKVRGGFLTNEHFMSHLLRHEADRQSIPHDVLSLKQLHNVSTDGTFLHTGSSDICELPSMRDYPLKDTTSPNSMK